MEEVLIIGGGRRSHFREESSSSIERIHIFTLEKRKPKQERSFESVWVLLIEELEALIVSDFIQAEFEQLLPEWFQIRESRSRFPNCVSIKSSYLDDLLKSSKLPLMRFYIEFFLVRHPFKGL